MSNINKKPVLFFDFDGLKFDTLEIHIQYINQKYGIRTVESDYLDNPDLSLVINKYLPDKNTHFTKDYVYQDISKNLMESIDWHKKVEPFQDMPEIVKDLYKKYEMITVTARPTNSITVIKQLIKQHIPGCIENVHCVHELLEDGTFKVLPKKDFILNHPGEKIGFFDDSPKEILRVHDVIPSYLFDPTGLHDSNSDIENRIRSWKQIGDLFL